SSSLTDAPEFDAIPPTLIDINVGELITDDFVPRTRVHPDSDLIRHGARRAKESSLHPEELSGSALQRVDGLVLTVNIITNRSAHHCFEHGLGRPGDGIAAHIDDVRRHNRTPEFSRARS